MKRIRNLMIMVLALIGLTSVGLLNVNASAPSSVTIKSKSSLYYYTEKKGTDYISGYNFYRKELTDGKMVYCVSNINTSVPAGLTLSLRGEISDPGLDYIIRNGYPYKGFTGDALKDYYITQSAIWEYYDETRGSNNWGRTTFTSGDTGMKRHVFNLVQGARSAKITETTGPSLNLVVVNKNMTLSNDNSYYVSAPIKVNMDETNGTYEVKLSTAPTDTIIKSTTGEVKNTFNAGEEFVVYVPASVKQSGTVKLSVSSKGTVSKSYEYTSGRGGYQDIGMIYETSLDVSESLTLNYEKVLTKVKISKQDITNKEELPGATLVIKDSSGNVVETWVSGTTPHYIEGLKEGNYTLTETIAPNGYILSSETIEFTLKADGKVSLVTMYNEREATKVKISKQDITSKEEVAGATLVIKDSSGNVVETWVSGTTPHYIEGLKEGSYTLTETIAPDGYILSSETITFEVKDDGSVTSVVMYNEKMTEVPITDLNINGTTIAVASVLMILGTGLVFYAKKSH